MATETYYQSKIIKSMIADGGTAVTGTLKTGEADIQGGMPYLIKERMPSEDDLYHLTIQYGSVAIDDAKEDASILRNIVVEVKTPDNYKRVMRAIKEVDGLYEIVDPVPLKKHEPLQIHKINNVRQRGGLGIIAHSYAQVKEYLDAQ